MCTEPGCFVLGTNSHKGSLRLPGHTPDVHKMLFCWAAAFQGAHLLEQTDSKGLKKKTYISDFVFLLDVMHTSYPIYPAAKQIQKELIHCSPNWQVEAARTPQEGTSE